MKNSASIEQVARWLSTRSNLLLLAHERPDGDAYGSLLGLQAALTGAGKTATVCLRDALPRRYRRLLGTPAPRLSAAAACPAGIDGVVCLDTTERGRLDAPAALRAGTAGLATLVVDHHPDNLAFGDVNWLAPNMAATAQMLTGLLQSWRPDLLPAAADALFAGLVMDTGGFRFANTDADAFLAAADLLRAGARHADIMNALFFSEPHGLLMLRGRLLQDATFAHGRRLLYATLSPALLAEYEVEPADTEGLIDVLRIVDGVRIACLLQPGEGHVRFSLRARDSGCPVNGIAQALGGGGHRLAAGATAEGMTIEAAERALLELTGRILADDGTRYADGERDSACRQTD